MAKTKTPQPQMSADELRWRAESDASTLKRHAELQNDPSRLSEAQKVIQNELACLQAVAGNTGANSTKKTASTTKSTAKKSAPAKTPAKSAPKKSAPASKYRTDNVTATSKANKRGK